MVWKTAEFRLQRRHGKIGQVVDLHRSLRLLQFAPRPLGPILVESARAGDEKYLAGIRMQPERKVERWSELSLYENPRHTRTKRETFHLTLVDSAENDRHAGKQRTAMFQEELQRRTKHGHDQIDFFPGVLPAIEAF